MSGKKVVAVFGATGQQGGSVVRELLAEGKWTVRALTRHPRSRRASAVKALGAEVQRVDLDDAASVKKALTGVHSTFLVTDFWDHMDPVREEKQGRDVIDAARAAGVQHLVYSGLEHVQALKGYPVRHFDSKGKVEEYLAKSSLPYTIVRMPNYFENFLDAFRPEKVSQDTFSLGLPMGDSALHGMSVAELGKVVKVVLASPDQFLGKTLGLSADHLTVDQFAHVLSSQLAPLKFINPKMTVEEFSALDFSGADDLASMFRFYRDGVAREVKATRAIVPDLSTFDQFVAANKGVFLEALGAS